jgi:hypothetical protein
MTAKILLPVLLAAENFFSPALPLLWQQPVPHLGIHTYSTKLHQVEGPGPENIVAKLQETTANSFNDVVSSLHGPITT